MKLERLLLLIACGLLVASWGCPTSATAADDSADDDSVNLPCLGDDELEDNDDVENAATTDAGVETMPHVCLGDEDGHEITASAGDLIGVTVTFDGTADDTDLYLMDAAGDLEDASLFGAAAETAEFLTQTGGTFFVQVQPYSDDAGDGVDYDIDVSIAPPPACPAAGVPHRLRDPRYLRVLCGSLVNLPQPFAALNRQEVGRVELIRDHRDASLDRAVQAMLTGPAQAGRGDRGGDVGVAATRS